MKEPNSFTVERLEELGAGAMFFTGDEVAALARIALAAKRAEPVGYVAPEALEYKNFDNVIMIENASGRRDIPLYTTPQLNSQAGLGSWIKCSDRLPENSIDVSLFHPEMGVFNGYCWRGLMKDKEPVFYSNSGEHEDGVKLGVTHWMPLPAAPEKTL